MKKLSTFLFLTTSIGFVFGVYANTLSNDEKDSIQEKLQGLFAGASIEVSDYNQDLKQVTVDSAHFFASKDGRYLFAGSVLDTHRQVDISAERDTKERQSLINEQPSELFISYPSSGEEKHQVTVFTDIDCPYCRKLHTSIGQLNDNGVSVHYVMLPRQGVGSKSYLKTQNALCSSDPANSITEAMRGIAINAIDCESNQLSEQIKLARRLKISSTPTLVLPNGELQIGLRSPIELLKLLEEQLDSTPDLTI